MAEEQKELSNAEQWDSTYEVMQNTLADLNEAKVDVVEVEAKEEPVDEEPKQPEIDAEQQTDTDTPTYQEAEAAQQESSDTTVAEPEEPTEAVSTSEEGQARPDLEPEDADVYGNLKPKAQERFEHWINRAKELESQNQSLETSKQVHKYIADSSTNPEQLQWAVELFRGLNSGDYNAAQDALKSLDAFADKIGEALGVNKANNESSSYHDFEDLSKAVDNLELSEDWANRLASERISEQSQHQAQERFSQANAEQYQYNQQINQLKDQAYNDIAAWEQSISSSDADYAAKKDIMLDVGREIAASNISPQDWLPTLQQQYNVLSRGMNAASTNGTASKKSGPLAPSRSSGGAVQPMSLDTPEVTPEFLAAHLEAIRSNE